MTPHKKKKSACFRYQPLRQSTDEIRLLRVHPGDWTAGIECTLRNISLQNLPAYKCLSYVWGDPTSIKPISVNGKSVGVTRNLWDALRRLRHQADDLIIWVDAICINQADDAEKSWQVALMRHVYTYSQETLVFLGEGSACIKSTSSVPPVDALARKAFGLLDLLAENKHLDKLSWLALDQDRHLEAVEQYRDHFYAIGCLASSSWWTRIWTVQEAALPSRVTLVLASERYAFDALSLALNAWEQHRGKCCWHFVPTRHKDIRHIRDLCTKSYSFRVIRHRWQSQVDMNMTDLRIYCARHEATDQRDFFYGILGLQEDFQSSNAPFEPDYSKTLRECLIEAGTYMLSEGWHVLLGRRSVYETLEVPSWLPDWAISRLGRNLNSEDAIHTQWDLTTFFDSARGTRLDFKLGRGSILLLQALKVDMIKLINTSVFDLQSGNRVYVLRQWMEFLGIVDLPGPANLGILLEALWRTVYNDMMFEDGEYRRASRKDCAAFFSALSLMANAHEGPSSTCKQNPRGWPYVYGKVLFTTENDRIGNTYPEAKSGDEVYVILGASYPFLLRRCDEMSLDDQGKTVSSFKVVGHCYVHGIMDGEALSGDWEERVETIALV